MNQRARSATVASGATPIATPADGYAGDLPPEAAWQLVSTGQARLIDVRTLEERTYVGRVPGSQHVAWATGAALARNPDFVQQVAAVAAKDQTLVLLCRSGKRSASAAAVLTAAGFARVYNIAEGFEGNLDAEGHRGTTDGWRFRGLPWEQD